MRTADGAADAALEGLSDALWQVRRVLDLLRFRLEEARLLELAGARRSVPGTAWELERVGDQLRLADLVRAVGSEELARILGTGSPATLAQLAAAAPGRS
ncbi:MAG: flagellar protein FlgN, partial [Actinomycetota bacterium]|nr:flagellar protein FlgN [Actinomycetota bacterium]